MASHPSRCLEALRAQLKELRAKFSFTLLQCWGSRQGLEFFTAHVILKAYDDARQQSGNGSASYSHAGNARRAQGYITPPTSKMMVRAYIRRSRIPVPLPVPIRVSKGLFEKLLAGRCDVDLPSRADRGASQYAASIGRGDAAGAGSRACRAYWPPKLPLLAESSIAFG